MDHQWKITRDDMKRNGCNDDKERSISGQNEIDSVVNITQYNIQELDLPLVCHF